MKIAKINREIATNSGDLEQLRDRTLSYLSKKMCMAHLWRGLRFCIDSQQFSPFNVNFLRSLKKSVQRFLAQKNYANTKTSRELNIFFYFFM